MPILNASLTEADIPAYVKKAFKGGRGRIVTIEACLPLWKLTQYALPDDPNGSVTPWWSPVNPYREDRLGARGRFMEARVNNVSFSEMVRYASAVRVDWNALTDYQEVTLNVYAKGYWGQYEPQPTMTPDDELEIRGQKTPPTPEQLREIKAANDAKLQALRNKGQYVPMEWLGGIEAYQFYIPNIKKSMLRESLSIPAHDKRAMALHLFHRLIY